jgi:hypothetical protein
VSRRRLRSSKDGLTAGQKSAEGILGHVVGKASEALRCRKAELTDRPSRERWLKARTRRAALGHESQERNAAEYSDRTELLFHASG